MDEAGDYDVIHKGSDGTSRGWAVRDDGTENQIARQQIPKVAVDSVLPYLTAVDRVPQNMVDQDFTLIDKFLLHNLVERWVA
ncbi:hypothetical protein MMAN_23020 [Mycobacterium mantenii]|uniref:Uncharacterized protein n=1 Tax=Mycobacterium mantenii TaxID=560555 RepID=A0ABM7JSY9_MYCNT|nr:hypothetical protein MMAN_23020 [Mycobacterium mantenii]